METARINQGRCQNSDPPVVVETFTEEGACMSITNNPNVQGIEEPLQPSTEEIQAAIATPVNHQSSFSKETSSEESSCTQRSATAVEENPNETFINTLRHIDVCLGLRKPIPLRRDVIVGVDVGSSKACALAVEMNGLTAGTAICPGYGTQQISTDGTLNIMYATISSALERCNGQAVKIMVTVSRLTTKPHLRRWEYFLADRYKLREPGQVSVCHDVIGSLGLLIPSHFTKVASHPLNATIINAGIRTSSALLSIYRKSTLNSPCRLQNCVYSGRVFCIHACGHQENFTTEEVKALSPYWIAYRALNHVATFMRSLAVNGGTSDVQHSVLSEQEPILHPLQTLDIAQRAVEHFNLGTEFDLESGNRLLAFLDMRPHNEVLIASFAEVVAQLAQNCNTICQQIFADVGITAGQYLKRLLARPRRLTMDDLGGRYCTEHLVVEQIDMNTGKSQSDSIVIALVGGIFNAWDQSEHLRRHFMHSLFWHSSGNQRFSVIQAPQVPLGNESLGSKAVAYGCARFAAMEYGLEVEKWCDDPLCPVVNTFRVTRRK